MAIQIPKSILDEIEAAEAPEPNGATNWDPEPGEFIVGPVKQVRQFTSDYGEGVAITIDDHKLGPQGLILNTVLRSWFEKERPDVGETVAIKFLGEAMGKNGFSYKNYWCKVYRENGQATLPATDSPKAAAKASKADEPYDPFEED